MPQELHVNVGGTWEEAKHAYTRVSGAWRRCTVYTKVSGVWEIVHEHLQASAANDPFFAGQGQLSTNSVTVTATFGVSPYTYLWTRVSSQTNNESANTPTSNVTFLTIPSIEANTGSWKCTVTDNVGVTTAVTVTYQFVGDPP